MLHTPASSRRSGATSPPLSTASISTAGQQQRLNVVTRIAVEGKAKQGETGVAIRMYLKVRNARNRGHLILTVFHDFRSLYQSTTYFQIQRYLFSLVGSVTQVCFASQLKSL